MFKPTFQAGCCRLLAQVVPKPSRSLWADRGGQAFLQYALLTSVLAAAFLVGKPTVSTALQNARSTMSRLEQAIAP
jgi:hypothetical protein